MGMHISGEHRYMLENMQVSRKSGDESRDAAKIYIKHRNQNKIAIKTKSILDNGKGGAKMEYRLLDKCVPIN
jgi:hypothetical protein